MTQTALVVGASGIVGSAITQLLIDNQWQVAALSRHPSQAQGVIPSRQTFRTLLHWNRR